MLHNKKYYAIHTKFQLNLNFQPTDLSTLIKSKTCARDRYPPSPTPPGPLTVTCQIPISTHLPRRLKFPATDKGIREVVILMLFIYCIFTRHLKLQAQVLTKFNNGTVDLFSYMYLVILKFSWVFFYRNTTTPKDFKWNERQLSS